MVLRDVSPAVRYQFPACRIGQHTRCESYKTPGDEVHACSCACHVRADRGDWCATCLLLLTIGTAGINALLAHGGVEREFLTRFRRSREALDPGRLGRYGAEDCGSHGRRQFLRGVDSETACARSKCVHFIGTSAVQTNRQESRHLVGPPELTMVPPRGGGPIGARIRA